MTYREAGIDGTEPLVTRIEAPANVLLLGPSLDATTDEACADLLAATAPPESRSPNLLVVSLARSPTDRVRAWERWARSGFPSRSAIVAIGENATPSIVSDGADPSGDRADAPPIDRVSSPGDLTNLGIATSERLSEMTESDEPGLLCFHSLTTLLQYADPQRTFRFVHTLGSRARSCGVIAHYHLDPAAHDAPTVATLEPLFDVVVDLTEADGPTLTALR